MQRRALVLAFALCGSLPGCADPVRSADIDALGGETPGIPAGPLHRAGQPCVLCHDGGGPGEAVFSFGGTVYEAQMPQNPQRPRPASDVIVHFIDAKKRVHDTATNCAGNFFVMKSEFNPEFPVFVRLQYGTKIVMPGTPPVPLDPVDMKTPIYRDGSCATCHVDPAGQDSTGHVFLAPVPINIPNKGCQ